MQVKRINKEQSNPISVGTFLFAILLSLSFIAFEVTNFIDKLDAVSFEIVDIPYEDQSESESADNELENEKEKNTFTLFRKSLVFTGNSTMNFTTHKTHSGLHSEYFGPPPELS